jgi:hypothetical protein
VEQKETTAGDRPRPISTSPAPPQQGQAGREERRADISHKMGVEGPGASGNSLEPLVPVGQHDQAIGSVYDTQDACCDPLEHLSSPILSAKAIRGLKL